MTVSISPPMFLQFFVPGTNVPLVGGKLFTYVAGTSTKQATWTDYTQVTQNSNPIILDSNGVGKVWVDPTLTYKYVLSRANDTDPPSSPIYSVDGIQGPITIDSLTQSVVGTILYPILVSESGVVNAYHPYGSLLRYGADPTGATDSSTAVSNAMQSGAHVFDDYPNGGTYLFNSETIIPHANIRISGIARNIQGPPGSGTTFVLATVAGSGAACLRVSATILTAITIEDICFTWQTYTSGQISLRFSQVRAVVVQRCGFLGTGASGTTITGIQFDGSGTYTGATNVTDNYFSAVKNGIIMGANTDAGISGGTAPGNCTSVRINNNDIYGNITGGPVGYGVAVSANSVGVEIGQNYIQAFEYGVLTGSNGASSNAALVYQHGNIFEGCTSSFTWQQYSTSFVGNVSIADSLVSGGAPTYPYNNSAGCSIVGIVAPHFDAATAYAYRGFNELALAANLGYFTTFSPTLTGSGSLAWGSPSPATCEYSRKGGEMTVNFFCASITTTGTGAVLYVTIPGSNNSISHEQVPVRIVNGGTAAIGFAEVTGSGTQIGVYCDATGSSNWSNSAGTIVAFSITFRILS